MRFAICNETWGSDHSFPDVCQRIKAAGYDGVEIAPFTLTKDATTLTHARRRELRAIAADTGLAIVGLHWLLVSPPGLHLTTSDEPARQRTADYLRHLADLCADLGGTVLVLGSPKQRSRDENTTPEQAEQRLLETIHPCLDTCAARNVVLCIEPLGPDETNVLNTLSDARRLITQADHPACRTIFDVKAASTERRPLPELIRENADIIGHVHANDQNRRGPGFGDTDFVPILRALQDTQYAGWVSVEVFDYSPEPDTIAVHSLQVLKAAEEQIRR